MMIDARQLAPGVHLEAEVCVVGAGAAGITVAHELVLAGRDVLLLEAGDFRYRTATNEAMRGSVAEGSRHAPPHMYRRWIVGGATSIWGGRCVPLDSIDVERRSWVSNSGWPISWSTLDAYYRRAHPYLEVGCYEYQVAGALGLNAPETIFGLQDPDIDATLVERFSPPTHFGRAYRAWLKDARQIRLVTGAMTTAIEAASGSVHAVHAAAAPGRGIRISAQRYVLAVGGIETVRLLMHSDVEGRGGLGNQGGHLGRNYMCHIEAMLGELRLLPYNRPIALHFERTGGGVYVRRKLVLSEAAQRRIQLLNTAFRLHHPLIADATHCSGILSAMYLVKDALLPEYRRKLTVLEIAGRDRVVRDARFWLSHVKNVALDSPDVIRFSIDWAFRRIFARRKLPFVVIESRLGCYPIEVNAEQVPNPLSRITLSADRDAYGIPRPHVDWRITEQDRESLRDSVFTLQKAVARTGIGRVQISDDKLDSGIATATPIGGHHIGTARMAASARDGVVDTDCRVHGMANLFVASSAVFPTCGHANPTLTILALAVRLADHLHRDLRPNHITTSSRSDKVPRSVDAAITDMGHA